MGASTNEIHEIVRNPTNFPFSEAPVFSLMQKYLKGTINMAEVKLLEELLNWRKASQEDVISLLNAWKKEGIFSRDIPHSGVNLIGTSEAGRHNRRILTHYLPEIMSLIEFKHPLQVYGAGSLKAQQR
jgi:methionine salvage enolase-phosphatase E1